MLLMYIVQHVHIARMHSVLVRTLQVWHLFLTIGCKILPGVLSGLNS